MTLSERINAFAKLSDFLKAVVENDKNIAPAELQSDVEDFRKLVQNLKIYNPWFIEKFVFTQLKAIAISTEKEKIEKWIIPYVRQIEKKSPKKIGVVMAGNIPLVGFHDFISVLITGNTFIGKLSSKDDKLPVALSDILIKINPDFKNKIFLTNEKLSEYEAIIATGSTNTSRYFEYYFSHVPNIIRKSRNSAAVLTGNETTEELEALADDILLYFGLGCRSISKIFVPENYNFDNLFKAVYKYNFLINEHKYANNYDYNRAVYLLNGDKFLDNGFFMIKEDFNLASPVSVLFYENYKKLEYVEKHLLSRKENLQCVVSSHKFKEMNNIKFGKAQFPELNDYEDNINTIDFLISI